MRNAGMKRLLRRTTILVGRARPSPVREPPTTACRQVRSAADRDNSPSLVKSPPPRRSSERPTTPPMPELPEVEVTRLSFAERIRGARVTAVRVGKPLRWPLGVQPETLVGQTRRRGEPARQVPVARARARRPADAPGHVGIALVRRRDRRAGPARPLRPRHRARHAAPHRSAPLRRRRLVGRRPTPRRRRRCSPASASSRSTTASTAPISTPRCAGAASPSRRRCSAARSSSAPATSTRARRCSRPASIRARAATASAGRAPTRLADAVRSTLARAVELGGSTLRNFRDAHGAAGEFQLEAKVYGRAGKPCVRCGTPIRRIVQGAARDVLLPGCQRR